MQPADNRSDDAFLNRVHLAPPGSAARARALSAGREAWVRGPAVNWRDLILSPLSVSLAASVAIAVLAHAVNGRITGATTESFEPVDLAASDSREATVVAGSAIWLRFQARETGNATALVRHVRATERALRTLDEVPDVGGGTPVWPRQGTHRIWRGPACRMG
jgi:hypothetical protein